MGKEPRVIDAKFEIIEPGYRPSPWWRRLYIDKRALLFTIGFGVLGTVKILLTGSLLGN